MGGPLKYKRILHLSVYLAATRVSHRVAQQKANWDASPGNP
jgi:hypothetical protein